MSESEGNSRSVMLFGRDISKIPCFRNSFLYGIEGGLAAGLVTFMSTSRPRLATHVAMASFTTITLTYWVHCRYKFSQTKFQLAQIKAGMQTQVMLEGTELENQMKDSDKHDV